MEVREQKMPTIFILRQPFNSKIIYNILNTVRLYKQVGEISYGQDCTVRYCHWDVDAVHRLTVVAVQRVVPDEFRQSVYETDSGVPSCPGTAGATKHAGDAYSRFLYPDSGYRGKAKEGIVVCSLWQDAYVVYRCG